MDINEEEFAICEKRGHVLRHEDLYVYPRTYGTCIWCGHRFKWVEPKTGHWTDEQGRSVHVVEESWRAL